jgi:TetR/AcrR family transcriptional regulator, lmrAB and yxaGH operons repressor
VTKPKTDSKARLIEDAARVFAQQGYEATSLSQIVKESGAPRGSVYFLFPGGKEEIAVETLKQSSSTIRDLLISTAESSSTIAEWLRKITAYMAQALESSHFRSGSPLAAVTFDTANAESDALGQICHKAYDSWIDEAASILHHKFGMDQKKANGIAVSAIGAIEGALILCRAKHSTEPLSMITEMLIEWVDFQSE